MARFHDILNQYGDAENLPENLLPSLMEAYDEDLSIPAAKVEQVEGERDELSQKVAELKALNFDLLRNSGGVVNNGSNNQTGENSNDGNEREVVTIDDLFE